MIALSSDGVDINKSFALYSAHDCEALSWSVLFVVDIALRQALTLCGFQLALHFFPVTNEIEL